MRPRNNIDPERQGRRDVTAGIIAVCLGVLIIAYGTGGDLELTVWIAIISAAFGASVREVSRRR